MKPEFKLKYSEVVLPVAIGTCKPDRVDLGAEHNTEQAPNKNENMDKNILF